MFSIAFFFSLYRGNTFLLLVSSHIITKSSLYFSKTKITPENKIKNICDHFSSNFFLWAYNLGYFIHNREIKGFGPIVIEENQQTDLKSQSEYDKK